MWPNPQFSTDLVIFTEEILNGKLHFLCSVCFLKNFGWNRNSYYYKSMESILMNSNVLKNKFFWFERSNWKLTAFLIHWFFEKICTCHWSYMISVANMFVLKFKWTGDASSLCMIREPSFHDFPNIY